MSKEETQGFVKLNSKGSIEFQKLKYSSFRQFGFWQFVGIFSGVTLAQCVSMLPFDKNVNGWQNKVKRYQRITFMLCMISLSYHGYKLAYMDYLRGKKALLQDKSNLLIEPDNY
jgi:hypothetical protein